MLCTLSANPFIHACAKDVSISVQFFWLVEKPNEGLSFYNNVRQYEFRLDCFVSRPAPMVRL